MYDSIGRHHRAGGIVLCGRLGDRCQSGLDLPFDRRGHFQVIEARARVAVRANEEHVEIPRDGRRIFRAFEAKPPEDAVRVCAIDVDLLEQAEAN